MHSLVSMLKYKRMHGTDSIKKFCQSFLHPTFGYPDNDGNYIKIVGDTPTICYAAHYDSVHKSNGMQNVKVKDGIVSLADGSKSECLGADCATGIWLILEMIDAGIDGIYVVHAQEETGCHGSRALVERKPWWLSNIHSVISFDRRGKEDIITHQMGLRTCSDAFAKSLASILSMGHKPDPTGSYTDSNEYAHDVPECTNLAVGYYDQHTSKERQDLNYVADLRDALITADWSKLMIERDPDIVEYAYDDYWGYPFRSGPMDYPTPDEQEEIVDEIFELVCNHPSQIAALLYDYIGDVDYLIDELQRLGADITPNKLQRYK